LRELTWTPNKKDLSSVALVRSRMLVESAKALGSGEIQVSLSTESDVKLIGFSSGSLVTTSLLMDGEYPPVRRLFPESSPITAVVKTADLVDATRRVSLVAERNSSVKLAFAEGEVVLDAGQSDDAQASESLEAVVEGGDITVAFNPQYLLDGLTSMMTDYVRLGFTQETKPVEFVGMDKPGGAAAAEFRYLLVPIRISS
jgi:DNA polymerase-3 subunit beta